MSDENDYLWEADLSFQGCPEWQLLKGRGQDEQDELEADMDALENLLDEVTA